MHRLWVSGYRSFELNIFKDDDPRVSVIKSILKEAISQRLNQTTDTFWLLSGPQMGVERWALQVGLKMKAAYPQLNLGMMLPYRNFEANWNEENQANLAQMISSVDFAGYTSEENYQNPQQLQFYQAFMEDHSDELLLIYDPAKDAEAEEGTPKSKPFWTYRAAQRYAQSHDYPISNYDFDDLQEAAEDWLENHPEARRQSY